MDYFRKYLGAQQDGEGAPSGAETVERLCDRVQSSTLLEDRRDAVRALKSLSKKFRLEVGTQAMGILANVLQVDRMDAEITGYALETLCNVMSNDLGDGDEPSIALPDDLGVQFTEMFMKMDENISTLLSLLEEYDFHTRWPTVKLLTILLTNKGRDLQEAILVSPMGVSRLMDLLSDSREVIRNDGLLLLIQLTRGNANIQKIVAFENAFERLIDIISEEGNSDGGIVVEDCLLLVLNLLKNNSSNQTFFKEGSFIQRLPPYFDLQAADVSPDGGWSAQKVTNIHLMLQLIRTLVSPSNPQQQAATCQRVMHNCGLLQQLCSILMASGVPADVLTETINTVSEVIRGNENNQEYFASVMAPSTPPRPAIVVLLMSMVNEKQPFVLRCAVLYCFESFLHKNELGQSQIIQTLLPSTADVASRAIGESGEEANSISAGQLLCGGLFSPDPLSTWFAAVALLHSIVENPSQKEQLLRVQLATSLGNPPVSLLQQCTNILGQGGAKIQNRVGLLMLLTHWLVQCPLAVTHFLHNAANVPFLISQVCASDSDELEVVVQGLYAFLLGVCVHYNTDQIDTCTRDHLRQIIEKRIGIEQFADKLAQVPKHESYIRAAKQPQPSYKESSEVIFDYAFTRLFKKLENEVVASLSPSADGDGGSNRHTQDQHDSIVSQYKELIREQDSQLNSMRGEFSSLQAKQTQSEQQVAQMTQQIQQLKDQNALMKAQRGGSVPVGDASAETTRLQKELEEKSAEVEKLKSDLTISDAKVVAMSVSGTDGDADDDSTDVTSLRTRVAVLEAEVSECKKKVEQREEEVKLYKTKYDDSSKQVSELHAKLSTGTAGDEAASSSTALLLERNQLLEKIAEQEKKVKMLEDAAEKYEDSKKELEYRLNSANTDITQLKAQVEKAELEVSELEADKVSQQEEADSQRREQEDLLVLLADQDSKLATYRRRLKELGETIESDDDDDDDDDDDLEDD